MEPASDLIVSTFWLGLSLQLAALARVYFKATLKSWDSITPVVQRHVLVRLSCLPAQAFYIFSTYRAIFYPNDAIRSNLNGSCSSVLTAWIVCSTFYLYITFTITSTISDFMHHFVMLGLAAWYFTYSRTWGADVDVEFVREAAVTGFCSLGLNSMLLTLLFLVRTLSQSTPPSAFKRYISSILTADMCLARFVEWTCQVYFLFNRAKLASTVSQRLIIIAVILAAVALCRLQWHWALRCYWIQAGLWKQHWVNMRKEQKCEAAAGDDLAVDSEPWVVSMGLGVKYVPLLFIFGLAGCSLVVY